MAQVDLYCLVQFGLLVLNSINSSKFGDVPDCSQENVFIYPFRYTFHHP